jgi:uracil-DNA glycosylase
MSIDVANIKIDDSWKLVLSDEFTQPYFVHIKQFLLKEKQLGHIVYPI